MKKITSIAIVLIIVISSCKERTCTCKDVTGATYSVSKTRGGSKSAAQSDCAAKQVGGLTCTFE